MANIMKNNINKLKEELNSLLYKSLISPIFAIIEQKIHLERSILALGIFILIISLLY